MSLLLAGLTVLIIGDSHMATPGYLISTLHDDLANRGAVVYSYGACGVTSGAWVKKTPSSCGTAVRLKDGPVDVDNAATASTQPIDDLMKTHNPNLVVVINGDTMAAYNTPIFPKAWIWQEVSLLTKNIKKSGVSCVWVGPAWGSEGGQFGKNFPRVKEMSGYLSEIVAPCIYVDSQKMSKPGEWRTFDGQHFKPAGYREWGSAIGEAISDPIILNSIKK